MAKNSSSSSSESSAGRGIAVRFTLVGLIVFSVSLVLAGGLLTSGVLSIRARNTPLADRGLLPGETIVDQEGSSFTRETPPWGELLTSDIEVERPEEYAAYETKTNEPPAWVFDKMPPEKARTLMLACGLDAAQVDRALSPALCSTTPSGTVVTPDESLLFSLSRETRAKFYAELGRSGVNYYMQYPYCFPADRLERWFGDVKVNQDLVARVKKLLYPRGSAECFSDFEFIMRSVPSGDQRLALVKALSRQPALLARLHVGPQTDVDRLLGYWGRGLQVKDARPLLEALKREPQGGNLSLAYLLPRFARERLYTFPLPPKPGEPAKDCHWSTMNFFSDEPDARFANTSYAFSYLSTNFYRVAKPSLYGDIVLVLDDKGNAIHSAVFLADDIVFTKNGTSFAQPWTLMRIKDMLPGYNGEGAGHLAVFRNKSS